MGRSKGQFLTHPIEKFVYKAHSHHVAKMADSYKLYNHKLIFFSMYYHAVSFFLTYFNLFLRSEYLTPPKNFRSLNSHNLNDSPMDYICMPRNIIGVEAGPYIAWLLDQVRFSIERMIATASM